MHVVGVAVKGSHLCVCVCMSVCVRVCLCVCAPMHAFEDEFFLEKFR
jgi:hypothetical protein